MIAAVLPWSSPPTQVNVWRGAHVWHVANTSLSSGELKPVIKFEALAGLDYLIERQCIHSMKAGCGKRRGRCRHCARHTLLATCSVAPRHG